MSHGKVTSKMSYKCINILTKGKRAQFSQELTGLRVCNARKRQEVI